MRAILVAARAPSVALALFLPLSLVAAEFKLPDVDATPAELVNAALRSELDGPSEVRKSLLDRALELDPNYAPARWHSGYVRWDDKWLTLDEVAKRAADDKQLAEYRKRRDVLVDRADDHRELARWCKKNGLVEEARVHWAKVLEFDPADADALSALGLQLYEGQLLTKQQIVEAKRLAGERLQAMERWQPQMVKWRKAIENLKGHDYDYALHEMRKLDDAEALPALEALFAENVASPKADALNLALIETAGRIASPEATQVLLRRAIQPDSETVRAAACDQLKKRPMYAYVPQLIAAIPGKIKTRFNIFVLPGGMVLHEHEVFLEGREADVLMTYTSTMNPADAMSAMQVTPRALAHAAMSAASIEARHRPLGLAQEALRTRVQTALENTTGIKNVEDPRCWQKAYQTRYHLESATEIRPRYTASIEQARGFVRVPEGAEIHRTYVYQDPTRPAMSCFPAGTLVATSDGMKPIETITVGDRVLSQDVSTGRLDLSVVQRRTLRSATPLLQLSLPNSRTISATAGHPFWVIGKGWLMCSELSTGDRLHSLGGAIAVEAISELPRTETYNLVVSDDHSYFVGTDCLLVHDNAPLEENYFAVPGLATQPMAGN
jgi:tetratricopeptide (TPR) repeat protein